MKEEESVCLLNRERKVEEIKKRLRQNAYDRWFGKWLAGTLLGEKREYYYGRKLK